MPALTLMTLPTELRMKAWYYAMPADTSFMVNLCQHKHSPQSGPCTSTTYHTRHNPVMFLLLIDKSNNAEVVRVLQDHPAPKRQLTVNYHSTWCVEDWLSRATTPTYISNFSSMNLLGLEVDFWSPFYPSGWLQPGFRAGLEFGALGGLYCSQSMEAAGLKLALVRTAWIQQGMEGVEGLEAELVINRVWRREVAALLNVETVQICTEHVPGLYGVGLEDSPNLSLIRRIRGHVLPWSWM